MGNETLSKGLAGFVDVIVGVGIDVFLDTTGVVVGFGFGVFLDTTGVVVGFGVGVCSDTTEVAVGLGVALGDGDVATVVVSLQPTNSAINNPGIAKFSFMFKTYLYV
ncbi:hypothetical protein QT970_10015 [Microcoleus sp. herbarium8]|uniref:hypothetical protein n=1 Tax=Microcoleus sp. herbarium8 TaxID=3055436 RepID=UPI002FD4AA29